MSRTRRLLALLPLLAVACTGGSSKDAAPTPSPAPPSLSTSPPTSPSAASPSPSATPSSSATATKPPAPGAEACPTTFAEPDPTRPVVSLYLTVADTKETVTGKERVTFTPDLPVDELVFRLWANSPVPRRAGGSSAVTRVLVESRQTAFSTNADRTIVTIPLGRTVPAGTALGIELDFTLTLPTGANERLGHQGGTAWFGSGFPLLAWERGRGWATQPPTSAFAESASSEVFRLATVEVDTAPGDSVFGLGHPGRLDGRVRRFVFTGNPDRNVRDLMIAVGRFRVDQGTRNLARVAVAPGLPDDPGRLLRLHEDALTKLAAKFGPSRFGVLDVVVVPYLKGGVEFPGGILLGTGQDRDATLVHEVAHQWFYAVVGNNQGRDPWLDEAFATYAEALVRGTSGRYLSATPPASGRNRVGAPMTFWESRRSAYYASVYVQGGAALLRARRAVGPGVWDRAVRCYIAANAFRIATPQDVQRAFAAFPEAIAILRRAGALPPR